MKKTHLYLLGGALVLLAGLAAVQAQEGSGGDMLYLRSPEERLARLDGFLNMGAAQKARVLRVLRRVDASVKAAVSKGDEDVRAVLDAERQAQFDELKSDTEVAPTSMAGRGNFRPVQQRQGQGGQGGQGSQGGQGGQGMGGQGMGGMQGGPGGQQGRRMGPGPGGRH
jgi:hypothetical protein